MFSQMGNLLGFSSNQGVFADRVNLHHLASVRVRAYHAHMTVAYETGTIPPMRLRYRLQIAREEAQLDQRQLAEMMGVGRSVIGNCEKGRTVPKKIVLNAWALACGVPVSWLAEGEGEQPPEGDGPSVVRPKGFEPLTF
ncbi:helix-turn-helix domain-containing protein [Mycobacteroides abscessus]|uniref:helix-turn-helix domain-containing protein n=2 Tax=Mycobacteroides abscessus TaxID=36809 RepID=UPI001C28020B